MNTAFHDAVNLAWKIHHVESGFASRARRKYAVQHIHQRDRRRRILCPEPVAGGAVRPVPGAALPYADPARLHVERRRYRAARRRALP